VQEETRQKKQEETREETRHRPEERPLGMMGKESIGPIQAERTQAMLQGLDRARLQAVGYPAARWELRAGDGPLAPPDRDAMARWIDMLDRL